MRREGRKMKWSDVKKRGSSHYKGEKGEMKYEGKFGGVVVYSCVDCPPDHVYFINNQIRIPPGRDIYSRKLKKQIRKMIKECKILGVEVKNEMV